MFSIFVAELAVYYIEQLLVMVNKVKVVIFWIFFSLTSLLSAYYTCMEFTRQLIKWIRMDYKWTSLTNVLNNQGLILLFSNYLLPVSEIDSNILRNFWTRFDKNFLSFSCLTKKKKITGCKI